MFDNLSLPAVLNLAVSWGLCILIWLVQAIIYNVCLSRRCYLAIYFFTAGADAQVPPIGQRRCLHPASGNHKLDSNDCVELEGNCCDDRRW